MSCASAPCNTEALGAGLQGSRTIPQLSTMAEPGAHPALTAGRYSSPGSAVESASGALTGRRPGRPQPRAAKRVTTSRLPTRRAAVRSVSTGGFLPAAS